MSIIRKLEQNEDWKTGRLLERKGMENMVENIKYIQDIVRKVNMHVTGILKAKRKNCPEVIFEEIQRKLQLITSESSN